MFTQSMSFLIMERVLYVVWIMKTQVPPHQVGSDQQRGAFLNVIFGLFTRSTLGSGKHWLDYIACGQDQNLRASWPATATSVSCLKIALFRGLMVQSVHVFFELTYTLNVLDLPLAVELYLNTFAYPYYYIFPTRHMFISFASGNGLFCSWRPGKISLVHLIPLVCSLTPFRPYLLLCRGNLMPRTGAETPVFPILPLAIGQWV